MVGHSIEKNQYQRNVRGNSFGFGETVCISVWDGEELVKKVFA